MAITYSPSMDKSQCEGNDNTTLVGNNYYKVPNYLRNSFSTSKSTHAKPPFVVNVTSRITFPGLIHLTFSISHGLFRFSKILSQPNCIT